MAKNKIKISNKNSSVEYQIKTRHRDKKLTSMSREVKNLIEDDWFQKNNLKTSKLKSKQIHKPKAKIRLKLVKKNKKDVNKSHQKDIKINLGEKPIHLENNKKGKNINQKSEPKKIYIEVNKYIFQGNEYFDLKEVLAYLYDKLKINLDSSNNKIKDKEEFKIKMNEILDKLFVIYFNKILITEDNLKKFLEYLSQYIKLEPNEIIKSLNMKNKIQKIEENIELEQYFKPKLILVEK